MPLRIVFVGGTGFLGISVPRQDFTHVALTQPAVSKRDYKCTRHDSSHVTLLTLHPPLRETDHSGGSKIFLGGHVSHVPHPLVHMLHMLYAISNVHTGTPFSKF